MMFYMRVSNDDVTLHPPGKASASSTSVMKSNVLFVCAKGMFLRFKVLGRGEKWNGGDYMSAPGGGQKVRLFKAALDKMEDEDKIILFIDRWSFILLMF